MPECGSQVLICDIPVRFDTYIGCSHSCSYCFVMRKTDISQIKRGESAKSLVEFIQGARKNTLNWCDWNIPLHWGGMSDPFQPAEKIYKNSLECLKVFAQTQYPFVVSTKNKLIATPEYLELIKKCDCVVQFSAACREYDQFERGASSFEERLNAASVISQHKRVIIRVQPYMPQYFNRIFKSLQEFAEAGVYGCVFEAMKYQYKAKGTIKLQGDFVYPSKLLERHFKVFKQECHKLGMRFYSGENRLRSMGDNLCCCGIEGMGWKPNTANLNHILYDRENVLVTESMKKTRTCQVFKSIFQDTLSTRALKELSFSKMLDFAKQSPPHISQLITDEQYNKIKNNAK